METRFSQRLSMLMKERKISGQRIADAIGKSQKTISRYANGEVDPSNEIKNNIYRVIADMSGIEEDATTEEELDSQEDWEKLCIELEEEFQPGCGEWELGLQTQMEEEDNSRKLMKIFHELTLGAKKYYMQNVNTFHMVEEWEFAVMELFHEFKPQKQAEFVKYLEKFDYNFEQLKYGGCAYKIAAYIEMVRNSENRPMLLIEKNKEEDTNSREEKELEEKYERELEYYLNAPVEVLSDYPNLLSYTPYDWYVLLRITIFELYDPDKRLWSQEYSEIYIGGLLDTLLGNMRTGD